MKRATHGRTLTTREREAITAAERALVSGVGILVLALLLIEAIGGRSWAWTGFQDNQRLWDWLHLLLLPVVLGLVPVLSRRRPGRLGDRTLMVAAAVLVVVVAFVVIGYTVPWAWTGFDGTTLWDWLELLLLPISVSLLPFVLESGDSMRRRWVLGFGLFLAALAVLAVPGYVVPWRWTGFTGNTLWDWIDLLVVPFALPVAVTLVLHSTRHGEEQRPR